MDTLNQNAFKLQKDTNMVYNMISRDVKYMWLLANGLNALITRSTKDFYNNFVQGKRNSFVVKMFDSSKALRKRLK